MEPDLIPQPRFADYVRPLTARWWIIVVAVVVATVGVYAYYAHKPDVYTTSTLVYVTDPGDPVTGVQAAPATDRNVDDVASLFDSRSNAAAVARRIGYRGSPQALLGQISVTSKTGEDFIVITAQSGSPSQAAAIANGFARQFVASLSDTYTSRIADAITLIKSQLAQAPTGQSGLLTRAGLQTQLQSLTVDLRVPTTVAQQVNRALAPGAPSAPKPARNALFAFVIALVGAIAACYAIERFDRRLKNPEDLERAYGTPLLAVLPHTGDPAPILDGGAVLGRDFREPFRVLRTNIELAAVDAPPRTIVVSSAMPGEGKSTVVRNLALAFSESGKRVVIVDLDLRHPSMLRMFAVGDGPGFTDVLRHKVDLEDATLDIQTSLPALDEWVFEQIDGGIARNGTNGKNGKASSRLFGDNRAHVALMRGGSRPANPPAALASARTIEVLDELRARYDLVLIDSAPVLAVTDTVPLLRYADAALFVGRFGVTTRDTVKRLRTFLGRVPDVNVLGIVANELPRLDAGSYGYGYGYGPYAREPASPARGDRAGAAEPPKQTV
jgi:Mrp family chromosome partitioning ATPase/capsular polysaccharide biosynthesis protein